MLDALPQPTTSATARHAVIGADQASQPGMFYADGSDNLLATLAWGSAWLPAVHAASLPTPVGAWSLSNPWKPGGIDTFGVYCDAGSVTSPTFSAVGWRQSGAA